MKHFLLFLSLSLFQVAHASVQMNCQGSLNGTVLMDTKVELAQNERNKLIGEFEGFRFFISSAADGMVELQAYNVEEPSRSYALGNMNDPKASVGISIWKREFLLEVNCQR